MKTWCRCDKRKDKDKDKKLSPAKLAWLVNFANNKRFSYFQLKTHLFYPKSIVETMIKHLQLHLPCSSNN